MVTFMKNIIRMIPCNFLSLSATIQNIGELKDVFQKDFHPEKVLNRRIFTTIYESTKMVMDS